MNYTKTNPIGIDAAIEQLQKPLYKTLSASGNIKGFGRVYKKPIEGGYNLEHYQGNGEYVPALTKEGSRFLFYVHDKVSGQKSKLAKVDLICLVNLKELMGDESRKDEEFRAIVTEVINKYRRFTLKETVVGMDYIHSLVSKSFQKTNIAFSDIHPNHAVTFQCEVTYELKTC